MLLDYHLPSGGAVEVARRADVEWLQQNAMRIKFDRVVPGHPGHRDTNFIGSPGNLRGTRDWPRPF